MQDHENCQETRTELDFTEHWSCFNVQNEILRGLQLRQEKPKFNKNDYVFVDHNIDLPSCSKSTGARIHHPKYRNRKKTKKTKLKNTKRKSKKQDCPLRVIELAQPLKRHCLNAWKNNSHTLPDYMIERLRNHIMDEKPIVKITDAENYFKKRKISRRRRKSKPYLEKYVKERRYTMMFCSILAYKILKHLMNPLNVTLNSELEKIHHVISDEIKNTFQTKVRGKNLIYKQKKMLTEISRKVTVWIANILEDTGYKQIEEQLEELEAEEGPVLDLLDDLIDNLMIGHKSSSATDISRDNDVESNTSKQSQTIISLASASEGDTENISEEILNETTDTRKPQSVLLENINPLQSKPLYEMQSDGEHEINEKSPMAEHLKSLLEEQISFLIDRTFDSNVDDDIVPIEDNEKIPSSVENNVENGEDTNNDYLGPTAEENDMKNKSISSLENISDSDKIIQYPLQNNSPPEIFEKDFQDNQRDIKLDSDILTVHGKDIHGDIDLVEGIENIPVSVENYIKIDEETNNYHLTPSPDENDMKNKPVSSLENVSEPDKIIEYPLQNNTSPKIVEKDYQGNQSDIKLQSDTFTVHGAENNDAEEPDEGTKKVKFSNINLGQLYQPGLNEYQAENTLDEIKELVVLKSSKDYIFSHFNIAPPNPKLLSFADEIWPEYSFQPLLKATESVSKSVTSLGRIQEMDERSIVSLYDNSLEDNKRFDSTIMKSSYVKLKLEQNQNEDLKILRKNIPNDVIIGNWGEDKSSIEIMLTDNETSPDLHLSKEMSRISSREKLDQDCGDITRNTSKKSLQFEDIKSQTNKSLKQSIEKSRNTDIPDVTNSMMINKKMQTRIATTVIDESWTNSNSILKWCVGLENVAVNLELWTVWIENVCSSILNLRYKGHKCKSLRIYNKMWDNLYKEILYDAKLWSELHRRLRRPLKKYKRQYSMKQKNRTVKCSCLCKQITSIMV